MDVMQTGQLLARIQIHDNRNIDELTVEEWHNDLAKVDYADALEAVRAHRRAENAPYLTIGHVLAGVRKIRRQRIDEFDFNALTPPTDPDDIAAYLAWRRDATAAVAAGRAPTEGDPGQLITRNLPALELRRPPRTS